MKNKSTPYSKRKSAEIIPFANYQLQDVAIDQLIKLGEAATDLDGIPFDVISNITLFDGENKRVDAKTALSRVALLILDVIHDMESWERE